MAVSTSTSLATIPRSERTESQIGEAHLKPLSQRQLKKLKGKNMSSNNRRGVLIFLTSTVVGLATRLGFARAADAIDPSQNALWPTTGGVSLFQNGHLEWVNTSLNHMQSIRPGMTRKQLEVVFERAGGTYAVKSTALLGGTYAYRYCGNFKIDVEFTPINQSEKLDNGRLHFAENTGDIICSISKPYVDHIYAD